MTVIFKVERADNWKRREKGRSEWAIFPLGWILLWKKRRDSVIVQLQALKLNCYSFIAWLKTQKHLSFCTKSRAMVGNGKPIIHSSSITNTIKFHIFMITAFSFCFDFNFDS